jgi:tRNA(Ser,Leu) C12 N-acetylase TAN1
MGKTYKCFATVERPQERLLESPRENPVVFPIESMEQEILIDEIEVPQQVLNRMREPHRRDLELKKRNLEDLKLIQKIISVEEDQESSLDEILARILSLYKKFVPYR